jgi:sulfate-transporting ATPase
LDNFALYGLLGLGSVAVYAIAAVGIVVIHRGTGTLNFAQGATALIAAEIFISSYNHMPLGLAVLVALLFGVVVNLLIAFLIMKPLANSAPLTRLLATLGLFALMQQVTVTIWGPNGRATKSFLPSGSWHLTKNLILLKQAGVLMLIAIVVCVALALVFARSRFGALTEAAAENPLGVSALGHSADMLSALSWGLGGFLAAAAGILIVPVTGVTPLPLALVILPAFTAAVIGGLRSFPMVLVGALLLGCGQSWLNFYLSSSWSDALPFLLIMVVITLRSSAIPGRAEVMERLPHVAGGRLPTRRLAIGGVALVVVALLTHGTLATAFDTSLLAGLIALSVVVLTGFAGQVSLAQYALVGMGALITARTGTAWGLTYPLSIVLGVLAAAVAGLILGLPAVRARGVALAVVTLGMGIAAGDLVFNQPHFVGAIFGTPTGHPALFGWDVSFALHPTRYGVVLAVAFTIAALAVAAIRRSGLGRRFLAVRDNERAAAGLGISVVSSKAVAFAVSAGFAGLSGALLVGQYPVIDYTTLTYSQSLNIVLLAIIGGVGWVSGGFAAGLFVPSALLAYILTQVTGISDSSNGLIIASSVGLLLTLVTNPDGIVPGYQKILHRFWTRPAPAAGTAYVVKDNAATTEGPAEQLEVANLSVRYGGVVALDSISFAVSPGEILGIIGPNGAGKTTLLDAISGFAPATGTVKLGSRNLSRLRPSSRARSGISRTFQGVDLFDDLSVIENIAVGADCGVRSRLPRQLPGSRPHIPSLVADLIVEINAEACLSMNPGELSGGLRRFAGLLRAVAQGQPVLMLDEPAASLDQVERTELVSLLRKLAREHNRAILLIEHDVDLVVEVSDRVLAIDFGREIFHGRPEDVRDSRAVRRAYLGLADEDEPATGALNANVVSIAEVPTR